MENYIKPYVKLIEKKNGIEAFALIILIQDIPEEIRITQKLCGELLHSPTKGKKALEVLKYYRCLDKHYCLVEPDFTLPDMEDETSKWDSTAGLICKLVYGNFQTTKSLLNYSGKFIQKASEDKRMEIEEFIPIVIKEIKKDEFWNKALSAENFVRKFDSLWIKFGKNIPKKTGQNLSELKEIF